MRQITLGFAAVLFLFGATLIAQTTQLQLRTETKGTFDRRTGQIKISSGGMGRGHFASFENLVGGFESDAYDKEGLARLKTILSNTYQGGEDISAAKPSTLDGMVEIEEEVPIIKFALSTIDSDRYASFEEALASSKQESGCQRFSSSCVRCPNGKKYCFVKNLLKPGNSARAREQ
jgi:hypothetical protein